MTALYLKQGLGFSDIRTQCDSTGELIDWSPYAGAMQGRDFDGALLFDLSSENGKIVIDGFNIVFLFSDDDTGHFVVPANAYPVLAPDGTRVWHIGFYDIIMTASLDQRTFDEGPIYLAPRITQ